MSGENVTHKTTVIEDGSELKGTLSSTCGVLVRGTISGEVSAPTITVAISGAIRGKGKATLIDSQGELSGEFDADEVKLAGRVLDDTIVRAKTLEVKLTSDNKMSVTFGETRLEIGDDPAQK